MLTHQALLIGAQRSLLAAVLLISVTGCSLLRSVGVLPDPPPAPVTPLSKLPYSVQITINASDNLNPGTDQQPSPVRLRLFLTEADTDLISQPFETLFEFDGKQPPAKPTAIILLTPGESRTVELDGMQSQPQLVVAAAFQDIYSSVWVANKIIDTANPGSNTVAINATSVEIQ